MEINVYLAGPIANLTYDQANAWRIRAENWLAEYGIVGRSPLRGKEFLRDLGVITIQNYQQSIASDSGIVARDRYDVMHADIMLVNLLGIATISVGTPVEYGWADICRVPTITIMEDKESPYDHPFIRALSSYRVETLEEGLVICRTLLT